MAFYVAHYFDEDLRKRVHKYLGGIVRHMNGIPEVIGGIEDHVYVLVVLLEMAGIEYDARYLVVFFCNPFRIKNRG